MILPKKKNAVPEVDEWWFALRTLHTFIAQLQVNIEQWYDVLSGNRAFLRSLPSGVKVWGKKIAKLQRVDRHVIEHSGI